MSFTIKQLNYADQADQALLIELLNQYAQDPMGGGEPLSDYCQQNLGQQLALRNDVFSFVLFNSQQQAIALANCIENFSTFKCKPVMNIHDFVVLAGFRGQGIAQKLLAHIEQFAKARGCCKLTLEVLTGNKIAQQAYQKFGFADYELDPTMGNALFWEKAF